MRTAIGTLIVTVIAVAIGAAVAVSVPSSNTGSDIGGSSANTGTRHDVALSTQGANGSVAPKTVELIVKSDEEKAVKGPDGNYHDAFIPANFSVQAGQKVRVVVYNYDDMKHSFTDPGLGVNATIAGGSEKKASKTTFTFVAPSKAGEYEWFCDFPCDPYSMMHMGLMRGEVTVS